MHIFSQSRSKWDASFVGAVSVMAGQDLPVESCPCRSSEGARDLFCKKAEIAEGLAGKCYPCLSDFDLLSLCHAQLGLCSSLNDNIHSLLEKPCIRTCGSICFAYRGRKVQCWLLQVFLLSITNGENVLYNKTYKSEHVFKYTNIWMPKCVETISVDAMHLFEIFLMLLLRWCELDSCGAVWGPIPSLKICYWKANAIRMHLSTELCGSTHMWFTSSFITLSLVLSL